VNETGESEDELKAGVCHITNNMTQAYVQKNDFIITQEAFFSLQQT